MTSTENWQGQLALMVAHCAGMVALVALPVLVGTLVAQYGFDAQRAGGLVTLYLGGAVAGSLFFAPYLNRFHARSAATAGYACAALAFAGLAGSGDYGAMALLHGLAGIAAGSALSFTHGTIGRSAQPHRLFGMVSIALGIFAIAFLGGTPKLVAMVGGPALYWVLGASMLAAACVAAIAFPTAPQGERSSGGAGEAGQPLSAAAWLGAVGLAFFSLMNATVFSFVERIGIERGFGSEAVSGVLVAIGLINLFPAPLAVFLERRWSARAVVLAGPLVLAVLALVVTRSVDFLPYAAAAGFLPGVLLFVHTFAFGLLARLDPSGRILAATPAMMMTGAALGPILGGTVVTLAGYDNLGLVVVLVAPLAIACFARARPAPAVAAQIT
ncbi:MAG: MFS transporter [Rhodocyclales bacterium GT-UBC]|nr:MAG: MFS transporter [Rhodocyclales bacterium GT-UBC]